MPRFHAILLNLLLLITLNGCGTLKIPSEETDTAYKVPDNIKQYRTLADACEFAHTRTALTRIVSINGLDKLETIIFDKSEDVVQILELIPQVGAVWKFCNFNYADLNGDGLCDIEIEFESMTGMGAEEGIPFSQKVIYTQTQDGCFVLESGVKS